MAKYTAEQIAKWLIDRASVEAKNGGEYLTQLKLQKLLYYAKGFFYVFENEPLFDECLKAQKYGPVVQSIVTKVKKYGREPIKSEFKEAEPIKDPKIKYFLEFIFEKISSEYTAKKLITLTHNEAPWQQTPEKNKINENLVHDFFVDTYTKNVEGNQHVVADRELFLAVTEYNAIKFAKAYEALAQ